MNLGDEILFFLSQHPGNYRLLRERMLGNLYLEEQLEKGVARRKEEAKREQALRITLSKLKKKELIKNDKHLWSMTSKGVDWLKKHGLFKKHFSPASNKKSSRKMVIAFDIPEDKRKSRDWLRKELVNLDFKLIQKSVWFGPAPLPKEFLEHLKVMAIIPNLKFFEVKETDLV